jgi:hypothetical protein
MSIVGILSLLVNLVNKFRAGFSLQTNLLVFTLILN